MMILLKPTCKTQKAKLQNTMKLRVNWKQSCKIQEIPFNIVYLLSW